MQFRQREKEPFDYPGNKTGCLLIHGFTGSPGEMRPLGDYLREKGYTVKGVLLPGHGTRVEDLAETGWENWYNEVVKAYRDLETRCDKIFVIGLSMGGALALHLAANENISGGIVSICSPIFLTNKKAYLAPLIRYFVKYSKKKKTKSNFHSFWYDRYPTGAVAQLVKGITVIKRELKNIKNPALIIQSTLDKTVNPASAQYIYDHISSTKKKLFWLHKSGHIATLDIERGQVFLWVEEFIEEVLKEKTVDI
ncbi:MAG: alpha/beta fold hydrolase [Clostridia bacterium]|nr:alpha/beta fold hydrolase [Clostridia bacterium]